MNEIERARSALNHLDAGCSRDEWVRIGMAAKSAGLSFDDFNAWSASAQNYENEKSCSTVWKSFDESGGITAATLYKMAFLQGWKDPSKLYSSLTNTSIVKKVDANVANSACHSINAGVQEIWELCACAKVDEAYITRKKGSPTGLRVYPITAPPLIICGQNVAGYLAVPCLSNGQLLTLQFIPPNGGKKLNLSGASFGDGFYVVGDIGSQIYLCEGIGQAWSIHQSTWATGVVCFGAGRMALVAKVLRGKYPAAHLVIVTDRGKEKQGAEIAASVCGQWVEMPNDKSVNYDANDYSQEFGFSALATLLKTVKTPEMRYKLLSGTDLLNAAPMRWIVHGVLPAEGLAALYGASGTGKSFLILDMGCSVADGVDSWFGLHVRQVPVTYICLEGEAGMGKRVKAWSLRHHKPLPDALQFITQPFNLLSDDIAELAKAIIASNGARGLVILDTLNRAAPGADENSSVDMGKIIAAAKTLQSLIGGLVLLVHHTGKDTTKGLRGHSSLYAALDGAIEVVNTGNRREWSVAKSKDDATGEAYPFKLEIVSVCKGDEIGETTSCVAVPEDNIDQSKRSIISPKSGNQKIIWEALTKGDLFLKSRDYGKAKAPAGKACIRIEDAIEQTKGRLVCQLKRQSERTQGAISGLVSRGLLGYQDGWLWVI